MKMDPTGVFSNLASTFTSSLAIAIFIKDVKNTPVDVRTCFNLTARVETDLNYLLALRTQHQKFLATQPSALSRLDSIILSTRQAIHDACRLLEGCREEVYGSEGGYIPIKKRMKWVLGDSGAFVRRTGNLQQQHVSVLGEIQWLRSIEVVKPLEELVSAGNTTFENLELMDDLRDERRRAKMFEENKSKGKDVEDDEGDGDDDSVSKHHISNTRESESTEGRIELPGGEVPPRYEMFESLDTHMPSPLCSPRPTLASSSPVPPASVSPMTSFASPVDLSKGIESVVSERTVEFDVDFEEDDDSEDAESAYYRDLRKQEDEKQRRRDARR